MRTTAVALAVSLAGSLASQQTWIVDEAGVPPFDFDDLPAAEAAASDGDTILVRAGSYAPIVTDKALTIRFAAGSIVEPGVFRIGSLAAGKQFVMSGYVGTATPIFGTVLEVTSNPGSVYFDRVASGRSLTIQASDNVTLSECTVGGLGVLITSNSHVTAQLCEFTGSDAGVPTKLTPSASGVRVFDSTLVLAQCDVTGGDGTVGLFGFNGAPAIQATNTTLRISGDARSVIRAGMSTLGPPVAAVTTIGGTVQRSPAVTFFPQLGAPDVSGTHTPLPGRPVAMTAAGAGPGNTVVIETISDQGDALAAFIGRPGPLVSTTAGPFGLDAAAFGLFASAVQGPSEVWVLALPLPPIPALEGWVVGVQALSIGATPLLSNHAVVVFTD